MRFINLLLLVLLITPAFSQIKVNQIGYLPGTPKVAIVPEEVAGTGFNLINESGEVVYSGQLSEAQEFNLGGETVRQADFSDFSTTGNYSVQVGSVTSYPFTIGNNAYEEVFKGSLKAFYYSRASTDLLPEHAGEYARKGGHPDTEVGHYPFETPQISAPKGWYDAGDYNKYIVNSGISTYTLLSLYEHYPEYVSGIDLNIPESGNNTPDLIDEIFWNLSWMLKMQDPADGRVYHKLSTEKFSDFIMPEEATAPRFVVQKTAVATYSFAATMAVASRIFENFQDDYPKYDSIFLDASLKAYEGAGGYDPYDYFVNPGDMVTGTYGFSQGVNKWASTELYITTKGEKGSLNLSRGAGLVWSDVTSLTLISAAANSELLSSSDKDQLLNEILYFADRHLDEYLTSPYKVVIGGEYSGGIGWGSNGNAANQSYLLLQAYKLTKDPEYLNAALGNLDYLLGKNPTGYSYVTGFGDKTPQNPHHRISYADGVPGPVPGYLVGGPHGGTNDACESYPSEAPLARYLDDTCSYTTNEVAINWNAPLAYVLGAVNAAVAPSIPEIASHPQSASFSIGGSHTFSVLVFNESDDLQYQWIKDDQVLVGQTSRQLALNNLQESDEGEYWVVVKNEFGESASRKASLMLPKTDSDFQNPISIPGIVEAEDFMAGGQSVGYNDQSSGNDGGAYRDGDVDIYPTDDVSGNFHVLFEIMEKTKYQIKVEKSGVYKVKARVSLSNPESWGGLLMLNIRGDGNFLNTSIDVRRELIGASWGTLESFDDLYLQEGVNTLTVEGPLIVNYLEFEGQWTDCEGVQGGLKVLDECGNCMLPDDPDFDNCVITDIENSNSSGSLRVYPVPATDRLFIDVENTAVEVYNLSGKRLLEDQVNNGEALNISGLPSGTYILKVYSRDTVFNKVFIKK